jgi:hypothetical protein
MLVIDWRMVLRRWKGHKPYFITQQPLPDPKALNAAIPQSEWEIGLDGKPQEPWKLTYVIYLVDLTTGTLFTYAHDTWGASQAYELLAEQIAVTRMLRGKNVFPVVQLDKRPWKSATYGMQLRPHLQPTGDWRAPGGSGDSDGSLMPQSPPPQISGPSAATSPTPTPTPTLTPRPTPTPATPTLVPTTPATPATPTAPPPAAAASAPPSSTILDHMKPVKPITVGEMIADEIPWK